MERCGDENRQAAGSAVNGRATRHEGYEVSRQVRKLIEEAFGRAKTVAGLSKTKLRRTARNTFNCTVLADNLIGMPNLLAALRGPSPEPASSQNRNSKKDPPRRTQPRAYCGLNAKFSRKLGLLGRKCCIDWWPRVSLGQDLGLGEVDAIGRRVRRRGDGPLLSAELTAKQLDTH